MPESLPTANLDTIAKGIREALAVKHQARERAFALSREVVRTSATSIRAVHRGEFENARDLAGKAQSLLGQILEAVADYPDLRYTGYVDDAQKEYTEASVTMALASGTPLPSPGDLEVSTSAYLNGLAEAASEMRRRLLDLLRGNEISRCESILSAMDDIYNVLVTIDFPDALTGGLRRTTDQLRGVLERTRGDLTLAIVQGRLAERLEQAERRLAD